MSGTYRSTPAEMENYRAGWTPGSDSERQERGRMNPPLIGDCYVCGDGVVKVGDHWEHSEDLGIDADGRVVVSECQWGRPYP